MHARFARTIGPRVIASSRGSLVGVSRAAAVSGVESIALRSPFAHGASRGLAKQAGKKGGKGGKDNSDSGAPSVNPEEFTRSVLVRSKESMQQYIQRLQRNLDQLRAGGAEVQMLEGIVVTLGDAPSDGKKPLSALATVSSPSAKEMLVHVLDAELLLRVERAINASSHNFVAQKPNKDTNSISVAVPKSTKDQREARAKSASEMGEAAKHGLRGVRKEAATKIKNAKMPEDATERAEKQLQAVVDAANKAIDAAVDAKRKELLH